MGIKEQSAKWIERDLIALIVVIFLFYGGLSCLYATFIPHLIELGLDPSERRTILIVVALVSLIGPALLGPLTDRIADRRKSSFGRYLRFIIALLLILGAILYSLLLFVPTVRRSPSHEPSVSFGCDASGAIVFQERCSEEKTCYHWDHTKRGSLKLTNCSYTCENPAHFEKLYSPWLNNVPPQLVLADSKEKADEYDYDDSAPTDGNNRQRRLIDNGRVYVEPPHICTKHSNGSGYPYIDKCHVYTNDLDHLKVDATLYSATNAENLTSSAEWCNYPLGKYADIFQPLKHLYLYDMPCFFSKSDGFSCNIPQQQVGYMKSKDPECKPIIECEIAEPYSDPSVLAHSRCVKVSSRRIIRNKNSLSKQLNIFVNHDS